MLTKLTTKGASSAAQKLSVKGTAMKQIRVTDTDIVTSVMGFGCASLGSRVAQRDGLAALGRALDLGVTWYDVAPSYGDGLAETILGNFVREHRDELRICTKVGIRPARIPMARSLMKPLARQIVGAVPSLRRHVKWFRPQAQRMDLTAEGVATSIADSLKRLKIDHVDVLALHDVDPADVARDDLTRALEDVLGRGQARAVSVAASLDAAIAAHFKGAPFRLVQFANHPLTPNCDYLRRRFAPAPVKTMVTHSTFAPLAAVAERLRSDAPLRQAFEQSSYSGVMREIAADFLVDYALASNPNGITLISAFNPKHFERNLRRLDMTPDAQEVLSLGSQLFNSADGQAF